MKDQELNFEGIEKQTLRAFTEKAYLDYSMYVILDRALPANLSEKNRSTAKPPMFTNRNRIELPTNLLKHHNTEWNTL